MKILTKQRLTAASNPIIDLCANSIHTFLNQFSYLKPFNASASQMTIDQLFDYCTKSKNGIEFENKLDKNVTSLITKYNIDLNKIYTSVSAFAKYIPQSKSYSFRIEYYIHYDYDLMDFDELHNLTKVYDKFMDPYWDARNVLEPITKSLRTTNSDININVKFYTSTPKPSYSSKTIEITAKPTKELLDSQIYTYLPVLTQFQPIVENFIDNLRSVSESAFAKEYSELYKKILKTRKRSPVAIDYGYYSRDNMNTIIEVAGLKNGKYTLRLEFRAITQWINQKYDYENDRMLDEEIVIPDNVEEVKQAAKNVTKALLKTKQFAKSHGFRVVEEELDKSRLKLVFALPR